MDSDSNGGRSSPGYLGNWASTAEELDLGRRTWFTRIESISEFRELLNALAQSSDNMFGYSEPEYFIKVDVDGPFLRGSVMVAWVGDGDWTIRKLPYYLRQQTELLDMVYQKFPRLEQDANWLEKVGTVYAPNIDGDAVNELLAGLPPIAIVDGQEKTERNFIEALYQRNYTDPSLLEGMSQKVFLSHSHNDRAFVRGLAMSLAEHQIDSWIDEAEIRIGESLIWKLATAIKQVDYVIAVLSSTSVKSNWIQKELEWAMTQEVQQGRFKVIPVIKDDCDVPAFLADKLYADFRKKHQRKANIGKLAEAINPAGLRFVQILRDRVMGGCTNASVSIVDGTLQE
jgi:hypothetical protein